MERILKRTPKQFEKKLEKNLKKKKGEIDDRFNMMGNV